MGGVRNWVRRLLRRLRPPDEEPALVGRSPRRPLNSGSVALEPPPEPDDVDARGREA